MHMPNKHAIRHYYASGYAWLMTAMALLVVSAVTALGLSKRVDHNRALHEAELQRHERMESRQTPETRESPNRQSVGGGPRVLQR